MTDLTESEKGADGVLEFMLRHNKRIALGAFALSAAMAFGAAHNAIEREEAYSAGYVAEITSKGEDADSIKTAEKQAKKDWTVIDTVRVFAGEAQSRLTDKSPDFEDSMRFEVANSDLPTKIAVGAMAASMVSPIAVSWLKTRSGVSFESSKDKKGSKNGK